MADQAGGRVGDDDSPYDPSRPSELHSNGHGRHFSWSILEDLDAPENPRRATAGVRVFDTNGPLLSVEAEHALGARVRAGTHEPSTSLDDDARDAVGQLVVSNLRLCIRPARSRVRNGQDFDDIVQNGFLGLIRAAEKFDPAFGTRFSTYAMLWIRQQMDRGLDREARAIRLPSHVGALQRRIELAQAQGLIQEGATPEEIARVVRSDVAHIDVARKSRYAIVGLVETEEAHRAHAALEPRSLEPDGDDEDGASWIDVISEDAENSPTEPLHARIVDMILNLDEREQIVIELHYGLSEMDPYTLEEIAEHFGLTRERVRQVRNKALETIRRQLALERAQHPHFDDDMNLGKHEVRSLASDELERYVGVELGVLPPILHPDMPAPRRSDPATSRRRTVRAVLRDLAAATVRWSNDVLLEAEPVCDDHGQLLDHIGPLLEHEPFSRRELVEALSEIVDDMGPEAMGDALLAVAQAAARDAAQKGLPEAVELARLLRLVRFMGCSTDPLGYKLVLRAAPQTTIELPEGSRVASTWHFDESDPEHVQLRNALHRHGERLRFEWNSAFDEDLDLVIAAEIDHRSTKTFAAVLAGVPICDIEAFRGYGPGQRLTVLQSPRRIPWTYVCKGCEQVQSHRRSRGHSCPSRCRDCVR